jgi:hypothetical protein
VRHCGHDAREIPAREINLRIYRDPARAEDRVMLTREQDGKRLGPDCFRESPLLPKYGSHGILPCKKRINTMTQFLDHLANDMIPALIDRLAAR